MDPRRRDRPAVVRPRQFVGGAIGPLLDQRMQQGHVHPPALAKGSSAPVSRWRRTQRCSVASPTAKRSATLPYVSSLDSYARTARSRKAVGYGFGMGVIDHRLPINLSKFWG